MTRPKECYLLPEARLDKFVTYEYLHARLEE